jgi:hypothetical protein
MQKKYYRMIDDVEIPNRWFLKSPVDADGNDVNPELFEITEEIHVATPLKIMVRRTGKPLDFTFADFDMPVASKHVAEKIRRIAGSSVQILPAIVENYQGQFMIMNVLERVNCLDESKSEFLKWTENDNRPDKVGQYRQVTRLLINSKKVPNLHIFRIDGWEIALIVSEKLKNAFLEVGVTGVRFLDVTLKGSPGVRPRKKNRGRS